MPAFASVCVHVDVYASGVKTGEVAVLVSTRRSMREYIYTVYIYIQYIYMYWVSDDGGHRKLRAVPGTGCGGVECTDNDNVIWNSHARSGCQPTE